MGIAAAITYQLCTHCAITTARGGPCDFDAENIGEVLAFMRTHGQLVPAEDVHSDGDWTCDGCGLDQLAPTRTFTHF